MDLKIILSEKGKPLAVLNNYKYSFQKKLKSGENRWICTNKSKCKSYVLTLGDVENLTITKHVQEHCHSANVEQLERQIVSASCKRKATDDLSEKPSKIIRKELQNDLPATIKTTDVALIRRNLYNARRKLLPPLPTSVEETFDILVNMNIQTSKGENFLLFKDRTDQIMVFSCQTNIEFIGRVKRIYLDGTFNYCPQFFCQFFTIHGYYNGHYIPLIFSLLPNKRSETYQKLFNIVKAICINNSVTLDISEIVVDFEKGIHKAVEQVWPLAQVIGCRFHLLQAWYRKIQQIGLIPVYKDESSNSGRWLRMTFALTFLNPVEVSDCFVFDLLSIAPPDDEKIQMYCDYLIDNYISEESLFPPTVWAQNSAELTRTTNTCESFHRHFNDSFYKSHPNIFIFVDKLKEFQIETYVKIQSVHLNAKIINSKVRNRKKFIAKMIDSYAKNEISRLHFIKCVSFHCAV